jgi:formyltetrahydrofolate deformylase
MLVIIQCNDRIGLLAAVSDVFASEHIEVVSMHEYRDTIDRLFYVRIETGVIDHAKKLKEKLYQVLPADASIRLRSLPEQKVIVLVSKEYHCLADILIRNQFKTLGASVQCVIGNHGVLQNICERFEIPFHLVSHENQDRISFENQLQRIIGRYETDYLVSLTAARNGHCFALSSQIPANFLLTPR